MLSDTQGIPESVTHPRPQDTGVREPGAPSGAPTALGAGPHLVEKDELDEWQAKPYGQTLIYNRAALFEMISQGRDLEAMASYFLLRILGCAAVYGLCLGFYTFNLQILASAGKLPVLLLGTLGICLPALFTFNVLLGSRLGMRQTLSVLLVSTYLTSLVLMSLAPIVLFFIISTPDKEFVFLLNLVCCTIGGGFGLNLLWQGMQYVTQRSGACYHPRIIQVWSLIYVFVGTQFSWLLRPFIGSRGEEFVLFRTIEGNFYVAVARTIYALFQ